MNERWCDFGPLRVGYDDTVLAPRPWTIVQSRHAAALLDGRPEGPLLELHCGAGHIGQAAALWSGRSLVQVDDDPAACAWARRNAAANAVRRRRAVRAARGAGVGVTSRSRSSSPIRRTSRRARRPGSPTIRSTPSTAVTTVSTVSGHRLPVAARLTRPGGAIVLQVRGPGQVDVLGDVAADAGLDIDVLGTVAVARSVTACRTAAGRARDATVIAALRRASSVDREHGRPTHGRASRPRRTNRRLADPVADTVRHTLDRQPLKDALSGTWLGHPLHPLLTDLPIGFWTSAFTLDLVGGRTTDAPPRSSWRGAWSSAVPDRARRRGRLG